MKPLLPTVLGEPRHASPLPFAVPDDLLLPALIHWPQGRPPQELALFEKAGPRQKLFFDRGRTRSAIVAGKTGLVISFLSGQFVHVPISEIAQGGKRIDLEGELWRAVLSCTGQAAVLA